MEGGAVLRVMCLSRGVFRRVRRGSWKGSGMKKGLFMLFRYVVLLSCGLA